MIVANTLAYLNMARIMTIKTIIVHARVKCLIGLHSNVRLPALPTNIGQGWKRLLVANTLAYFDMVRIMTIKGLIVHARVKPGKILHSDVRFSA
jgi:hypothetical protein